MSMKITLYSLNDIHAEAMRLFLNKNNLNFEEIKITNEQLERMIGLPRAPAKISMKRLGNKIVYELSTPGIKSHEDVFVSKLESGYEIKATADKKVYVNSIPLELPLRMVSLADNKLIVEFNSQEE